MKKLATVCALLAPLTACDLALLPEFATYEGEEPVIMDVEIHAIAMPDSNVQTVEIELGDVLLHHAEDDKWVIAGPESLTVEFGNVDSELVLEDMPLDDANYDLVYVEVLGVRVEAENGWRPASVVVDHLELDLELGEASAFVMEIGFDLSASLSGNARDGWSFDPALTLEVSEASEP